MRPLVRAVLAAALLGASAGPLPATQFDSLRVDLGALPSFKLTDQLGRTVTRDDLLGKVWVANFFFSHCAGDCSKTSATMAKLQHDLDGLPDVLLVGFSVDPEDDTAEVLRAYGERWGADPERWRFLTGPEKEMFELIQKGFKQAVLRNPEAKPGFEVVHTFSLMVVDARGHIRGYVDGRDPAVTREVTDRVKELLLEGPAPESARPVPPARYLLPAINATLNGLCGVLLVLGYVAIRRRWVVGHKVLMLAALAVSAAFLACYLYYHFAVLRGRPTRFSGQGWARPVYLGVLLSHTVLAALVAPLALAVAWLGLTGRLAGHVRLARWTLPVWLYVSVTGVLVYWMLYHLYPPV